MSDNNNTVFYLNLIEKENALVNQRLHWGMIFQGILFAAIFIGSGNKGGFSLTAENIVLTSLGAVASMSLILGTLAAHFVIRGSQAEVQKLTNRVGAAEQTGLNSILFTVLMPHFCLPALSLVCWVYLATHALISSRTDKLSNSAQDQWQFLFVLNFAVILLFLAVFSTLVVQKVLQNRATVPS
ncbi:MULTISPECIES: hypothetical protein [Ruegeria]|uniref:hypothetical protein n=1 Tax=Ruegeria TaxID=97050 RepID=UPI001479DE79|nr:MULTISPECIES: hypothetical protein [Ruegeria]